MFFLFFKQKTAYEMRISDWSSDVCSSDLSVAPYCRMNSVGTGHQRKCASSTCTTHASTALSSRRRRRTAMSRPMVAWTRASVFCEYSKGRSTRSEEHTSELQSLMRISYAVFCLKQKKKTRHKKIRYNVAQPIDTTKRA